MKNSGVEWIGEIPDDWDCIRFKYIFSILGGCGFKEEYQGQGMGNFPFCKASDINGSDKYVSNANNYVNEDLVKKENYTVIPKNSILISKIGEALKKNHRKINTVDCIVDSNCEAFVLISKNDISYFYYVLKCIDMNWFDNGGTIPSINNRKLLNFSLPFINLATQQKIAAYLDSKCSKIEETIRNQQQVIEKLKAYKQSLITEAVTGKIKIQNSKAYGKYEEYKDSGVEYLGLIPQNWNVKRLRYIGKCQNGISKGGEFFGSGFPFVSYGDVYNNLVLPENVAGLIESIPEEQENYSVKAGDIFFTRTSETIEEVGFTSVCLKTIENATFAGFVIRVRPFTDELIPDFSKYYFSSDAHRRFFVKEMNLVTRASLSQDLLKRLPVLIPSKEEQKCIAKYLDKKCTAINTAIEQKQNLIEKLTEYKKSLIYECVTGKKEI